MPKLLYTEAFFDKAKALGIDPDTLPAPEVQLAHELALSMLAEHSISNAL